MAKITDLESLKEKAKNGVITDEERQLMMQMMDDELEDWMKNAERRSGKHLEGWTEENWEEEMMEHPMFVTQDAVNRGEISPMVQGMIDLKYNEDENTPLELAESYREDGNFNFKCKKYRYAVLSYSEGLKHALREVDNVEEATRMKAKLMGNRSASQFFLKNYRSSLIDCRLALKFDPTHFKVLSRAIQCCFELKRFKEAMDWCDHGLLKVEIDESKKAELKTLRFKAEKALKEKERNDRKEAMLKKKKEKEHKQLLDLIKARGIKIETHKVDDELKDSWDLDDLEPSHPAALNKRVHLEDGYLVWPVLFLYPEFGETDFIQEFVENQHFSDHLDMMFGDPQNRPGWDANGKYSPSKINIYFEDKFTKPGQPKMILIDKTSTLTQALCDSRYHVIAGTPCFVLMVKGSQFESEYLRKYY